jgi:uncharacterized protein involved in outer membrane biogenesis
MAGMKTFLGRLATVAVIGVAVLYLARNPLAGLFVRSGLTDLTGLRSETGQVDLALLRSELSVHDVSLGNPAGFDEPVFVAMPEIFVAYHPLSVFSGNVHLERLRVVIDRVVIEKNAAGETNVGRLKAAFAAPEGGPASPAAYRVDDLEVRVGSVVLRDRRSARTAERTLHLDADAHFRDVSERTDIARLVLLTLAARVRPADLGIDTKGLRERLGRFTDATGISGKAQDLAKRGHDFLERFRNPARER